MVKEIVWTETAAKQRRHILNYWLQRNKSPDYPTKLIQRISERTNTIARFPKSGKKTTFPDTRISSMGHYSILYKIGENKVIVTAFWDNRQDPKKLLKILTKEN